MNKFKIFLNFVIITVLFFITNLPVLAADLNIDCPASPTACSKTGMDPFFSDSLDGFWYPGKSITKTLSLKNSGLETREMAIRGTRTSTVNILENVMHISIVGGTTVIWGGSVADFYGQDKIGMGIFAPGVDFDYDFTVSMSSAADDNYQSKGTVFDLTLGFWGEVIPTPTPTPSANGGTVLGAGVSAPVCNDTKPSSAPFGLTALAGLNSVTLTWNKASDPVSYYLVAYGTSSGSQAYGNPNVGGSSTTSYIVTNLSGGVTYYFKVRAGNGCMPGDYSNELSATPGGGFIAGPAAGFAEGVLGVGSEEGPEKTPIPTLEEEVLGEEGWSVPSWAWVLFGLGVGGIIIFFFLRKYLSK